MSFTRFTDRKSKSRPRCGRCGSKKKVSRPARWAIDVCAKCYREVMTDILAMQDEQT